MEQAGARPPRPRPPPPARPPACRRQVRGCRGPPRPAAPGPGCSGRGRRRGAALAPPGAIRDTVAPSDRVPRGDGSRNASPRTMGRVRSLARLLARCEGWRPSRTGLEDCQRSLRSAALVRASVCPGNAATERGTWGPGRGTWAGRAATVSAAAAAGVLATALAEVTEGATGARAPRFPLRPASHPRTPGGANLPAAGAPATAAPRAPARRRTLVPRPRCGRRCSRRGPSAWRTPRCPSTARRRSPAGAGRPARRPRGRSASRARGRR